MSEFLSWQSYHSFAYKVIQRSRYIHDEVSDFLTTLWETRDNRIKKIKKGSLLWRAQVGCDYRPFYEQGKHIYDEEVPYSQDRMSPLPDRASEGRANPKGRLIYI